MIPASRVNRCLAISILTLLAIGPALAQQSTSGSPVPLTPDAAPPALEAPPPGLPGTLTEDPAENANSDPDIEIGELENLDADSAGILAPSNGGLGIDMWAGTERATLLQLLPRLPARYSSPALRDLARRMLMSAAIAPPREEGTQDASLIGLRVERLAAMGLSGAVADMMGIAPAPESDPLLMRTHIDNRLLLGDHEGACRAAATGIDMLQSPYREQIAIFCDIQAGNRDAATFSTNLLRESGELEDPAFLKLAEVLTAGGRANIESLPVPRPIHLAMAGLAEAPLPADVLQTDSPLMLQALANSPLLAEDARLAAAERATLAGVFAPASLAERYSAVEFSGKELDNALSIAGREHTPRNRALLYQAARLQNLPVARAAAMQKAWELGRADGVYRLAVLVYRPDLEALQPGPELLWFAPEAVRALLFLDRPQLALAWAAMAQRSAREPEDRIAAALLWPLVALAEGSATGSGHDQWLTALAESEIPTAYRESALAYSLLEATGERIAGERWDGLLQGAATYEAIAANPAYLRRFRIAASGSRRGETVLLALLILGPEDLGRANPTLVSETVVGLRTVGLEQEARQLSIESALAAGI